MSVYILVVDDEPDVEALFRQQFRRDIKSERFGDELIYASCLSRHGAIEGSMSKSVRAPTWSRRASAIRGRPECRHS